LNKSKNPTKSHFIQHIFFNMAGEVHEVKCDVTGFSKNVSLSDIQNCTKCVELEARLQQAPDGLSSVQFSSVNCANVKKRTRSRRFRCYVDPTGGSRIGSG
jgi:hypothetical protein